MIEYETFEEAQKAIHEMDGTELLTQTINVDWAFSKGPFRRRNMRRRYVLETHFLPISLHTRKVCLKISVNRWRDPWDNGM